MRTTVTLEADVEALLKNAMREQGLSFKEALNRAVRSGLGGSSAYRRFETPTFSLGVDPQVSLDKALCLAAELEDDDSARKLAARK
ncbi:MAG: antitoxin [Candidatus Dormibacteraeota bacterium]|nr:antitoxin [Candidatus Dormibacteraeota bacterium]